MTMRLLIWTRDQGPLDTHFKDGDIFQVHPDDWEPGAKEIQRWLCVEIPDDPTLDPDELQSAEYATGPGGEPVVRRMRKYRFDYAPMLTPDELAAARDPMAEVPVIQGRYTKAHIVRK